MSGELDPIDPARAELSGHDDLFVGVATVIRETQHRVLRSTNAAVLGM